ncbi:glycoside hydrolase family 28 protein [Coniophora puteana RWD-64-598 SS2]|uniref:Glycoside hydrolase family 28 protein n=1 Tax=Coniophora puteana (strain RWD-64-598) TaxID=741705 RepID=A0A5M3MWP8_CONPW|nr:glycoside hydrolase family 28 protein [Coniophora puteana RWD-64-598 SS2]EIW83573.1 glycoside hydrolase family 28 protein [Coniophora puteana RWD-64-598 SS2]
MVCFSLARCLALLGSLTAVLAVTTCDVTDYGGVADNSTDLGPAITKAYSDCVSGATTSDASDTVLLVPSGDWAIATAVSLTSVSDFTLEINGAVYLVFNADLTGTIFSFDDCDNIIWQGEGHIWGNGELWRPDGDLSTYPSRPRLVRFQDCNNVDMSGVALHNAPMFHVTIIGDNNVAHDMSIIADHIGETDGFDISGNNNYVHDVYVENGDECVTVKTPTNGFVGENIQCYYSAGKRNIILNVYYKNVTHSYGDGGIVLKSYPTASGTVKNATYVDFTFSDIAYPIQVSDFWCPNEACPTTTGDLTWSDITFTDISGTGDDTTRPTIQVECISGYECENIVFNNVDITKEGGATVTIQIENACGSGLSEISAC